MTDPGREKTRSDATQLFVANFQNTRYEDLPPEVVRITKDQVLDFFGVALGGSGEAGVAEMRDLVLEWGGATQSSIFRWGDKVPAPNAAQVNATMAHSLDFDDVHEDAIMHPGVVAIPTALAMSEYAGGVDGREFLTVVALATDFICRCGLATRPGESKLPYGWHLTTLYGAMTAAFVAARLLRMDAEAMTNAVGIAYHQASGNGQCVQDGALTKRMGPGMAVRSGIASALMAKRGITGAHNCLEGKAGLYKVYHMGAYSREKLIDELGTRFEGINVSIKPYPCCRGVHAFCDAGLALASKYDVDPNEVQSILIECGEGTYGLLGSPLEFKATPRNPVDSQFSIVWGVGSALARRRVSLDDFTWESIKSPDILGLTAKTDVQIDHDFDRGDQGIEPARRRENVSRVQGAAQEKIIEIGQGKGLPGIEEDDDGDGQGGEPDQGQVKIDKRRALLGQEERGEQELARPHLAVGLAELADPQVGDAVDRHVGRGGVAQRLAAAGTGPRIVVSNPLPWRRDGVVRVSVGEAVVEALQPAEGGETIAVEKDGELVRFTARDVPAGGYRTYVPVTMAKLPSALHSDEREGVLESPFYRAVIDEALIRLAAETVNPAGNGCCADPLAGSAVERLNGSPRRDRRAPGERRTIERLVRYHIGRERSAPRVPRMTRPLRRVYALGLGMRPAVERSLGERLASAMHRLMHNGGFSPAEIRAIYRRRLDVPGEATELYFALVEFAVAQHGAQLLARFSLRFNLCFLAVFDLRGLIFAGPALRRQQQVEQHRAADVHRGVPAAPPGPMPRGRRAGRTAPGCPAERQSSHRCPRRYCLPSVPVQPPAQSGGLFQMCAA